MLSSLSLHRRSAHYRFFLALLYFILYVPLPSLAQARDSRAHFSVEVLDGHSLQPDGLGPYVDGVDGVVGWGFNGIVLCTYQPTCTTLPEDPPSAASVRALVLDLSDPLLASGARDLGVVRSGIVTFGAMWEQDKTRRTVINGQEGWVIRSPLEIPVDSMVTSERVEIRFFLEGVQHILQFGPWTAGQYQTSQGPYTGEGTIQGTITRIYQTEWVLRSPPGSVGRLWDNRAPSDPRDLGLYRFSYEGRFTELPDSR